MNAKVNFYFAKAKKWQKEMEQMRMIALDCSLDEELKWGVPCYTFNNANIVLIHAFKDYCAFLFFKGALIEDKKGILIQQTENVQAARQVRFTNISQVIKLSSVLKAYIYEAIEVQKSGLTIKLKKTAAYHIPEEFQKKLTDAPGLKKAFEALTPGRQRGYLLYFSAAKQSKTRESRIEKSMNQIFQGKGLND